MCIRLHQICCFQVTTAAQIVAWLRLFLSLYLMTVIGYFLLQIQNDSITDEERKLLTDTPFKYLSALGTLLSFEFLEFLACILLIYSARAASLVENS
jgi:hypothetical protein